ncbi:MAG TPA: type IV pilus secretin PilQ [Burkholderiaceae bacterium]
MIVTIKKSPGRAVVLQKLWHLCVLFLAFAFWGTASAQQNAVESVTVNQQGQNVIAKIKLKTAPGKAPIDFKAENPARIWFDFEGTANDTGKTTQEIGVGDVRSASVVQWGERTRVVFNLNRPMNYAQTVEGDTVIVTMGSNTAPVTAVSSTGIPVSRPVVAATRQDLQNIDFRRGSAGEGRVIVSLPNNQMTVDARQQGRTIVVNFLKAGLPETLRRRLDVSDFGTPVQSITTTSDGDNVRMVIEPDPKGLWEHSVYQSDTQLVVEVKPVKEQPNKLVQGTQGYRGEKISFNFQDVDLRAVLGIIADESNLNIIASDTVTGKLTLKVKDIPWDQALDVVMQVKGLDMRKNGTVVWIAPKDELLTKEKLELEQKAQIAELEPLKTESFQLNYEKADAFKTVFNVDTGSGGGSGGKNRLLSPRGSATIDPRTNQLFITDIPAKLEEIRNLIAKVDVATRQVEIEARIVEATDNFSRNLGAQLGVTDLRQARGGTAGYEIGGGNSVSVTGTMQGVQAQTGQIVPTVTNGLLNQFVDLPAGAINGFAPTSVGVSLFNAAANRFLNLELSALEADGKGKVVSSPRVVTADAQKALIEQGTQIPYVSATSSGATAVSFINAELSLSVTPQITPDGNVILDVDVHNDSVGQTTAAGLAINTKHVKTQALVENGGTVVLGGIFVQDVEDNVTKTPLLGDIPILGNLFKTTSKSDSRTELLIFITPKIISNKLTVH